MLHVIERIEPVKEHEHRVKEADLVTQALGQSLDEPHHVVAEVANGAGNERRQSRQTHRLKTLDACSQKRNGIFFFPNNPVMTFQDTRAVCVTKHFFRICSGKRVTGDFFAAFNAFQKKRMSRALRDSKIGADRRKKVSRENIVNRNEVALFSEALKLGEGRLNHSDPGPLRCDSLHENGARGLRPGRTTSYLTRNSAKTALRIAASGACVLVQISH